MTELEDPRLLWRIRSTLMEMLEARGYIVDEEQKMNQKKFEEKFGLGDGGIDEEEEEEEDKQRLVRINRERLFYFTQHKNDSSNTIFAYFPTSWRFRLPDIKKYYSDIQKEGCNRCIIVLKSSPKNATAAISTQAKRAMEALSSRGCFMEVFHEKELRINITKHDLVPKHIPLSDDEKSALMERYKLKEDQLPRIYKTDPIARYFGMQKGQVFKLVRPSETAGRYVTYRLVV